MPVTLRRSLLTVLATALLGAAPSVALAGVSPSAVDDDLDPGSSIHVTKTVSTPVVPPRPDIVFVVDSTGSMGPAIANVQSQLNTIVSTVKAQQADAQFAVTDYKDVADGAGVFTVRSDLTGDPAAAQAAINGISAGGGGDTPEAQLNALWQVGAGGNRISFRPGSSRVVVWFGDASGHDPSMGHTLADAVTSLQGVSAKVVAINVAGGDGLNATGQATAVTSATGGQFFPSVAAGSLSQAILEGLTNLPVTVTAATTCDPGLSVSFSPSLPRTVTSGSDLVLEETISVAPDARQGSTLTCTTRFKLNGADAGEDFVQRVAIAVNDVTPPTVACGPGVNPSGRTPGGWQQAGLFRMVADDNLGGVSVTIRDDATGTSFGPYAPGTYFKLTQAPGRSTSTDTAFAGAVDRHFAFRGDATLTATDAAGNTASATCSVPPQHK
ncbi:MAG TPA: vWA domain-containing protein [Intrasporangium sp.]|nr:vWA domain-containing protein [Intrasporangium sp.]